jgi:hypothetical protein
MTQGWETLSAAMATARAEIAAAAPDAATAAEGEAYLLRVLTTALADTTLGHILSEGGLTPALPTRGGPNPDYLMRHAPIDPTRRYRIEGRLNASERVGVGVYTASAPGGELILAGYAAFEPSNAGPDGRFALDLGPDATGEGAIALSPQARALIVRILHRDREGVPAQVRLEGPPAIRDLSLAGGAADAAQAMAAQMLLAGVRQFLLWSREISAAPNRLTKPPAALGAAVQGDPDTVYIFGYYDLAEGEWLEAEMPEGLSGYWSLHASNHWCETLPGAGVHDRNAKPDPDGRIRVRIGPTPPAGLANAVDTLGRRRGVLICRYIGTKDPTPPAAAIRGGAAS